MTSACSPRRSRLVETGSTTGLDAYSETCLRRVWRAEHFSWWMTQMLHRPRIGTSSTCAPALAAPLRLDLSRAAATALAENYVGLAVA